MRKAKIDVIAVGTPDISKLSASEQQVFFETLYARILELANKKKEN
jgi:hypothetical protein